MRNITTPAQLDNAPSLGGLRVCISGAVPEREHWGDVADLDRLILAFVAQLSALIVRYGGQVIHGSQPLLTPAVAEQAGGQSRERSGSLKLFASQLFGELPDVTMRAARMANASVVLTSKVGDRDAADKTTRDLSLTAMRLAMVQDIDVIVAVGGKLHRDTGYNPGVLEELAQARWHKIPCFVIGAFGGAAGTMDHQVISELSRGNLLSEDAQLSAATWSGSMDEQAGRLLAHFLRHTDELRMANPVNRLLGGNAIWPSPLAEALRASVEEPTREAVAARAYSYWTEREGHGGSPEEDWFRAEQELRAVRVIDVDPDLVKASNSQFSTVLDAMNNSDVGQLAALLRRPAL